MFRKRDPQGNLFETSNLIPLDKAKRLKASWAEPFQSRALPLIDEDLFASMYCDDNGRPNRPVQTVFGVLILKEMFDLTDEEALEHLEFNLLWHHALRLTPEEAHLCQKTLHNFRAGLMEHDLVRLAFEETTNRIIEALGLKVSRQRLDSTHVVSHIAILTRLGLFCETIRVFLSTLESDHPRLYGRVSESLRSRYVKADGEATRYGDARSGEGRRRLSVCARDLYRVCELFRGTEAEKLETYGLLERLLEEQCEVVDHKEHPSSDDDDRDQGGVPVVLKDSEEVSSSSLQSPHDADATYNNRKGKGYEVQVAETCHEDNEVEMITHVEVTDSCSSDVHATVPTVTALAERGIQPEELVADTTYGSGDNAVAVERLGTELISPVAGSAVAVEDTPAEDRSLTPADFIVSAAYDHPTLCPAGHASIEETESKENPNRVEVTFDQKTCEGCSLFHRCPAKLNRERDGYVLSVDLVAANIEHRRRVEASGAFKDRYAIRAGIEGTNSELKRGHGLGLLRVRGRPRVELAVYLKALACNFKRMVRSMMPEMKQSVPAMA
ncbi:MAG: transposase [Bacteroidetes bacterium]|nr:transposase [Bacteroidota bacterium]